MCAHACTKKKSVLKEQKSCSGRDLSVDCYISGGDCTRVRGRLVNLQRFILPSNDNYHKFVSTQDSAQRISKLYVTCLTTQDLSVVSQTTTERTCRELQLTVPA
jgi:hypothetical protein